LPSAYLLQIFWRADKQRYTLSRGNLPEFARNERCIGFAICREQDHVVTVYPAERLSLGQMVGCMHINLTIPENCGTQLLLQRVTINEENCRFSSFSKSHGSCPRMAFIANSVAELVFGSV